MKPIGPLMIEHRTVERVLSLLDRKKDKMRESGEPDYVFIDMVLDFFDTFVDRFHHGKEEKILFERLGAKHLLAEQKKIMEQLIAEHAHTRDALKEFRQLRYGRIAEEELIGAAAGLFENLGRWYTAHIEKEDRHFFLPAMEYLSEKEQEEMLRDFSDFDKTFVGVRYEAMIGELEALSG